MHQTDGVSMHQQMSMAELRRTIYLDTGANMDTIGNPELVFNVRPSRTCTSMRTNNGVKALTVEADMGGRVGPVWFDPGFSTNIFGFSKLIDEGYHVHYDSRVADEFHVTDPYGLLTVFKRDRSGLYGFRPSDKYIECVSQIQGDFQPLCHATATMDENQAAFTTSQFDRAKTARRVYHSIGAPTLENFKTLLRINAIRNCPVTPADVQLAESIFGPDMGTLKGKATRTRPVPVREDTIDIPLVYFCTTVCPGYFFRLRPSIGQKKLA
jgi:hypothetical protein